MILWRAYKVTVIFFITRSSEGSVIHSKASVSLFQRGFIQRHLLFQRHIHSFSVISADFPSFSVISAHFHSFSVTAPFQRHFPSSSVLV
jgi:hypothetical protein